MVLRAGSRFCERAVIAIRRHGARRAVARAARRLVRRLHAHEQHTWYELDLRVARPRLALPQDLRLRLAEDWNRPSHRALARTGFRPTAEMKLDRAWGRSRVAATPLGGGTGALLAGLILGGREG